MAQRSSPSAKFRDAHTSSLRPAAASAAFAHATAHVFCMYAGLLAHSPEVAHLAQLGFLSFAAAADGSSAKVGCLSFAAAAGDSSAARALTAVDASAAVAWAVGSSALTASASAVAFSSASVLTVG